MQDRLNEAGWSLTCERFVDLTDPEAGQQRFCTWRAEKGIDQIMVKCRLGDEQTALRYLYDVAKTFDADLQQLAMEAGSGGWVFDLSQTDTELHGREQ